MTAIVYGAAGFRRVVYRAEVLPLGGTHFRTAGCRAWRFVGEEGNDDVVGFDGEEATELVQPQIAVERRRRLWAMYLRWSCQLESSLTHYGAGEAVVGVVGEAFVEGQQIFLCLEGRVDLWFWWSAESSEQGVVDSQL